MAVFQIRRATPDDIPGMVRVRVDTWKSAYKGILGEDFLEDLSYETIMERWRQTFGNASDPQVARFVAENQHHEIVGIAICGPERTEDPRYRGEIYVLYVLPSYQRQGIGRKLVAACVRHLWQTLGIETMLVWVIAENPFRRFYESLGGKPVRYKTQEIGGRLITESGYGWQQIKELL